MPLLSSCSSEPAEDLSDAKLGILLNRNEILRGRVVEVISDETDREDYGGTVRELRTITFRAQLTHGDFKGGLLLCRQDIDSMVGYRPLPVEVGDRLFLYLGEEEGTPVAYYSEVDRSGPLVWIVVIFALALLLFGRTKGLRSLIALILTCAAIFLIFLPRVSSGASPVWSSILVCVIVTFLTMLVVAGFSAKSLASTLGCFIGILTAGLFASIAQTVMKITGYVDEQAITLAYNAPGIDMAGLLFAATIIGAMGATMDVSISIATSLEELARETEMKPMALMRSGLKIGRDIMGTMSNTLILAYVGGSLHLILLLIINTASAADVPYILSWEMLSTEIIRAVAGSLGLILAVPATALASALLYRRGSAVGAGEPDNPF